MKWIEVTKFEIEMYSVTWLSVIIGANKVVKSLSSFS